MGKNRSSHHIAVWALSFSSLFHPHPTAKALSGIVYMALLPFRGTLTL